MRIRNELIFLVVCYILVPGPLSAEISVPNWPVSLYETTREGFHQEKRLIIAKNYSGASQSDAAGPKSPRDQVIDKINNSFQVKNGKPLLDYSPLLEAFDIINSGTERFEVKDFDAFTDAVTILLQRMVIKKDPEALAQAVTLYRYNKMLNIMINKASLRKQDEFMAYFPRNICSVFEEQKLIDPSLQKKYTQNALLCWQFYFEWLSARRESFDGVSFKPNLDLALNYFGVAARDYMAVLDNTEKPAGLRNLISYFRSEPLAHYLGAEQYKTFLWILTNNCDNSNLSGNRQTCSDVLYEFSNILRHFAVKNKDPSIQSEWRKKAEGLYQSYRPSESVEETQPDASIDLEAVSTYDLYDYIWLEELALKLKNNRDDSIIFYEINVEVPSELTYLFREESPNSEVGTLPPIYYKYYSKDGIPCSKNSERNFSSQPNFQSDLELPKGKTLLSKYQWWLFDGPSFLPFQAGKYDFKALIGYEADGVRYRTAKLVSIYLKPPILSAIIGGWIGALCLSLLFFIYNCYYKNEDNPVGLELVRAMESFVAGGVTTMLVVTLLPKFLDAAPDFPLKVTVDDFHGGFVVGIFSRIIANWFYTKSFGHPIEEKKQPIKQVGRQRSPLGGRSIRTSRRRSAPL